MNPKPSFTETKLINAITDIFREIEKCPEDSMVDIANEFLDSWETGYRMNHNYTLDKI